MNFQLSTQITHGDLEIRWNFENKWWTCWHGWKVINKSDWTSVGPETIAKMFSSQVTRQLLIKKVAKNYVSGGLFLITTLLSVASCIASSGLEIYGYVGGKIIVWFEQRNDTMMKKSWNATKTKNGTWCPRLWTGISKWQMSQKQWAICK